MPINRRYKIPVTRLGSRILIDSLSEIPLISQRTLVLLLPLKRIVYAVLGLESQTVVYGTASTVDEKYFGPFIRMIFLIFRHWEKDNFRIVFTSRILYREILL